MTLAKGSVTCLLALGRGKDKELAALSLVLGANSLMIPFLYFEEKKNPLNPILNSDHLPDIKE